jgi:hypothetical protein
MTVAIARKTVCIYVRVSDQRQVKGTSIEMQRRSAAHGVRQTDTLWSASSLNLESLRRPQIVLFFRKC